MSTSCSRRPDTDPATNPKDNPKGGSISLPPFRLPGRFVILAGTPALALPGKKFKMNYLLVFIGSGLGSSLRQARIRLVTLPFASP